MHYNLEKLLSGLDHDTSTKSFAEYLTETTKQEHREEEALSLINILSREGLIEQDWIKLEEKNGIGSGFGKVYRLSEKGSEYKRKRGSVCTRSEERIVFS